MANNSQQELLKTINQAKPEKLKNVLLKMGSLDPDMAALILAIFNDIPVDLDIDAGFEVDHDTVEADPLPSTNPDTDPQAIEEEIRHVRGVIYNQLQIARESDWDWNGMNNLVNFFSDLLGEVIDDTGELKVPFALGFPVALMVVQNQMKVFSEDSLSPMTLEDSVNNALGVIIDLINESGSHLPVNEREKYLDQALKLFSSPVFKDLEIFRYEFIDDVLGLVTKQTANKVIKASERIMKQSTLWDEDQRKKHHLMLRLHLYLALGDLGVAQEIAIANMDDDDVRKQWFFVLKSHHRYDEAKELALDVPRYRRKDWDELLSNMYQELGETDELIALLRKRLLNHQTAVYQQYKQLLVECHEWQRVYPDLLKQLETKLSRYEYGDILALEREYSKLFEQLKKYQSAPMIRNYLRQIYPAVKDKMIPLYHDVVLIPQSQKTAANAPKQLEKDLSNFLEISHDATTVQKWVDELKQRLSGQTSFLEGLEIVQTQINTVV